jgi:hypothetical protein
VRAVLGLDRQPPASPPEVVSRQRRGALLGQREKHAAGRALVKPCETAPGEDNMGRAVTALEFQRRGGLGERLGHLIP